MKRWIWILGAVALLLSAGSRRELARLEPVELLYIYEDGGMIVLAADTGDSGKGKTLEEAEKDLKDKASGQIFLDTAEELVVTAETEKLLPQLRQILRPAMKVCLADGEIDPEQAAAYLRARKIRVTLGSLRDPAVMLPKLERKEGRYRLV